MMSKLYLSALVSFLLVFGAETSAQQSIWTTHSSVCEAINPAQAQMMQWRPEWLINKDPNRTLWVMCPVMSKYFDNDLQDSVITIGSGNDNDLPIKVNCILRIVDLETERLTSHSQTKTIAPGTSELFAWQFEDKPLAFPNIACNLPPNGTLLGIISAFIGF